MRALPHPQTREGVAALTALAVILVATTTIGATPVRDRPDAAAILLLLAAVAGVVVGAVVSAHRLRARHQADHVVQAIVEAAWFDEPTLHDYPAQAIAALLPATGAPSEQRLQAGWVLATHGHDAPWLEHQLGLPQEAARLLVDTFRTQRTAQHETR
jgi:hypothetical protein